MEEETKDQATEGTESEAEQAPQQASEGQSETTDVSEETPKTYDVLGKNLNAEELYEFYKKQQAYVTNLEKEKVEREARVKEEVETSLSKSELLANVDPNVKEALSELIRQEATNLIEERDIRAAKKAADEAFTKRLDALEGKYSGGNGLPKFDRKAVLTAMQEPGNDVFDPEVKFMLMNKEAFDDFLIKEALKKKSGGVKTEDSGGSTPKKPEGATPRTWEEAGRSALSRL